MDAVDENARWSPTWPTATAASSPKATGSVSVLAQAHHPQSRCADPRRADGRPRPEADHRDPRVDQATGRATTRLSSARTSCPRWRRPASASSSSTKGKVVAVDTPDNLTHRLRGRGDDVRADRRGRRGSRRLRCSASPASRASRRPIATRRPSATRSTARPGTTCAANWRTVVDHGLGPAGTPAGPHEPRGHLPAGDHRRARRTGRQTGQRIRRTTQ